MLFGSSGGTRNFEIGGAISRRLHKSLSDKDLSSKELQFDVLNSSLSAKLQKLFDYICPMGLYSGTYPRPISINKDSGSKLERDNLEIATCRLNGNTPHTLYTTTHKWSLVSLQWLTLDWVSYDQIQPWEAKPYLLHNYMPKLFSGFYFHQTHNASFFGNNLTTLQIYRHLSLITINWHWVIENKVFPQRILKNVKIFFNTFWITSPKQRNSGAEGNFCVPLAKVLPPTIGNGSIKPFIFNNFLHNPQHLRECMWQPNFRASKTSSCSSNFVK